MNDKPLVTTMIAIMRATKEFALKMGLSDEYAEVLTQVHIQTSAIIPKWSEWLLSNCLKCEHIPEECHYLHPKKENCIEGATPQSVRDANCFLIETGRISECPGISRITLKPSHLDGNEVPNEDPIRDLPKGKGLS